MKQHTGKTASCYTTPTIQNGTKNGEIGSYYKPTKYTY
jgi:hypothetical protein